MTDHTVNRFSRRTKTLEVHPDRNDVWRFESSLVDQSFGGQYEPAADHITVHDFVIAGKVEGPDLLLTALEVSANQHPFEECPQVAPAAVGLVGYSLLAGWRTNVLDRLKGAGGCTHVTTLLLGLSEVTTLVHFQRMNAHAQYGARARASGEWIAGSIGFAPALRGACHALREDGPVIGIAEDYRATHERSGGSSG